MKYINSQDKKICVNLYNVQYFFVKELSVYASFGKKEILLGTFNTKEDAQSEYNYIITTMNDPLLYKKTVYQVNTEEYWITNRMEREVTELFRAEADYVTQDYDCDDYDDIEQNYIDPDVVEHINKEDIENDYYSSDSVDNE